MKQSFKGSVWHPERAGEKDRRGIPGCVDIDDDTGENGGGEFKGLSIPGPSKPFFMAVLAQLSFGHSMDQSSQALAIIPYWPVHVEFL